MERRRFGHSPRPLTGPTGPNRPVVTHAQLLEPLRPTFTSLPLFPGQLTHPSAQMFVEFGHVSFGIS